MAGALYAFNSQRKSFLFFWVLVVAQLAERSLLIPEACGSSPGGVSDASLVMEPAQSALCEIQCDQVDF